MSSGLMDYSPSGGDSAVIEVSLNGGSPGPAGADGDCVELRKTESQIQWKYGQDSAWQDLVALADLTGPTGATGAEGAIGATGPAGVDGADGAGVELQANTTHLLWRTVGGTTWRELMPLSQITGADGETGPAGNDGKSVELRATETHLQYRLIGDADWTNVITLSQITGPQGNDGVDGTDGAPGVDGAPGTDGAPGVDGAPGTDGREVVLQHSGEYIQWKYDTDASWTNLIAVADLTGATGAAGAAGAPGAAGATGADGREIKICCNGGYIQWKYDSDTNWNNLVSLSSLTGATGPNKVTGTTATDITGLLKGNGSTVVAAVEGADYSTMKAAEYAVRSVNGDSGQIVIPLSPTHDRYSLTLHDTATISFNTDALDPTKEYIFEIDVTMTAPSISLTFPSSTWLGVQSNNLAGEYWFVFRGRYQADAWVWFADQAL